MYVYVHTQLTKCKYDSKEYGLAPNMKTKKLVRFAVFYWYLEIRAGLAYFFIQNLTGEMKANIIKIALQKCQEAGVKIVSLTFDGCAQIEHQVHESPEL